MISLTAMIILISLAMIIDRIMAVGGIVYLAENGNADREAKNMNSEKHEEIGIEQNLENRNPKLKEEAHCI